CIGWGWKSSYNFDGYTAFHYYYSNEQTEDVKSTSQYFQVFRNGIIENVYDLTWELPQNNDEKILLLSNYCEGDLIIDSFPIYMNIMKAFDASIPFLIMVTLINVKNCLLRYEMWQNQSYRVKKESN